MKVRSISLALRKMQIKPTMRYHRTPIREAIIKKWKITSAGKGVEELDPCTLLLEM